MFELKDGFLLFFVHTLHGPRTWNRDILFSALKCFKEGQENYFSSDLLSHLPLSGCLEEGLEALLKATGSNLLILKISHCPNLLTDRSLWLASCYCRALQAVTYRWRTDRVVSCFRIKMQILFLLLLLKNSVFT